jgi:hypothetical protein
MGVWPSSPVSSPREGAQTLDKDLRKQVRNLLSNILYAPSAGSERRRQIRYPFP